MIPDDLPELHRGVKLHPSDFSLLFTDDQVITVICAVHAKTYHNLKFQTPHPKSGMITLPNDWIHDIPYQPTNHTASNHSHLQLRLCVIHQYMHLCFIINQF